VLDLGAGTGVLGLIAARLGARRVYLVEPEDIISVAEEIVRANGLQDRVQCLRGRIEDVNIPERVDLIVSVMTGNFLVTEDLLPVLFKTRDRFLRPGGLLLPSAAAMEVVPVSAPAVHAKEIAAWSTPQHGVDLSVARGYAANTILYKADGVRDARFLADPATLLAMDFSTATSDHVHGEVNVEVTRGGVCHGWLGWFRMQLGDRWLSTSPREAHMHWSPAFMPLDPPLSLARGERAALTVDRPPRGDWTWQVKTRDGLQRHSTLLAAPMTPDTLRAASRQFTPALSDDGRAVVDVLTRCDGVTSVDALAEQLGRVHPDKYADEEEAVAFVQRAIRRLTR
jgi:SAM-dependent methyltransferase